MAYIPKNKQSTSKDINFEVLLILFAIFLIGSILTDGKVHKWLSPVLLILFMIAGGYLILPSSKNQGYNGYMSVIFFARHMITKAKAKVAKNK